MSCDEVCTYTPDADWNGLDAVTFTVSDGQADSAPATVDITVTPVNDAPTATSRAVSTDEDTPVVVALDGSDVDGDVLSTAVTTAPTHGTLSCDEGVHLHAGCGLERSGLGRVHGLGW